MPKVQLDLISWGCAAALSESLKPGDLILADKLIDAGHVEIADSPIGMFIQKQSWQIMSSFIVVAWLKVPALFRPARTKNNCNPTGAIASGYGKCRDSQSRPANTICPFLAIRAIVDPVKMNLPNAMTYSLNGQGDVVLAKLLLFLFTHPLSYPD